MTTVIILSFLFIVLVLHIKECMNTSRFRKTIHPGDTVRFDDGRINILASVESIPGKDQVILRDLTYDKFLTATIENIHPL